ncbi:cellulose biosynthesis protein BcsS [Pseudolabrys taiwanensis]|uniref:Cellulose biosynthesis protein BcsS n=2 Tax=Pseudolabrys taiwanensis TaxID=331696 RepID=A0A345ZW93_9HYPH|nr:cellulose biosynthesis protein BcsS [Pseudolabrys taiwanensis]
MAYRYTRRFVRRVGAHARLMALSTGCILSVCIAGAAQAADVAKAPPPPFIAPVKTYSTVVFGGFDDRRDSYYGYAGVVSALNGKIATDGFLVRVMGLYNPYKYSSTAVVGGTVDGKETAFEAMLGYQTYLPGMTARFYAGLDYEGHRLSPNNPFDRNDGDHWGVHVRGEIESPYAAKGYYNLHASYGSATQRYWIRGRAGYNFSGVILGPEGLATGNWVTNEQRVGAFVIFRSPQLLPFEISFSGGYSQTDETRGGKSAYGTVEVSVAF